MDPLNRFGRMMQEFFVARVREIEGQRESRKAEIRTREQAEAYQAELREKIARIFGPLPERTPLNARVTGRIERDAFTVEKLIFESRPEFLVTANLYLPRGVEFPRPGVVGTCGHSNEGKAADTYQAFAQGLARLGYVVLIYDPIGQGERLQYVDMEGGSRVGIGVREHLYAGNQQLLVGEVFATWRAWDGIRALDYLLSRPEVDPEHVGITGNSGGGTLTTWLTALEPRWTMSAPSCFVTTFRRNLENELPADTEQCPPGCLALGLDMDDFLAVIAPKPLIVLSKEKDYFDQRGSIEAAERLRRLYAALGAEDQVEHFAGPTYHGFTEENRTAMYRWFHRATGQGEVEREPELTPLEESELFATETGQVAERHSRTVFSFTCEKSQQLAEERGSPRGDELCGRIRAVLRLGSTAGSSGSGEHDGTARAPGSAADYRILRTLTGREHPAPHTAVYAVETEPGIQAIVYLPSDEPWYSRPLAESRDASRETREAGDDVRAVLYVSHLSSDEELRSEPFLRDLHSRLSPVDSQLFACDLRGVAESQPVTCTPGDFAEPYGSDYFYAMHALMLDRPYVGMRVHDLLSVLDWLAAHGYERVHLAAMGHGAVPAAMAAVLDERVVRVTLKHALSSYTAIAESEDYAWPVSLFPPNVLAHFDLPDCYAELEAKQLELIEPWDAMQRAV